MNGAQYLKLIDEVNEKGKFKPDWGSLSLHKTPEWYQGGKIGVFIHWGIYSVPAFGSEWYAREMYDSSMEAYRYHRETFGDQKAFGYKDFIPMFKGEKFDAESWISLFKRAGIRYVMPVAEHHDGFAMYDTAFNRWNAKAMGPKRDVLGELKTACEKNGLTFCASSHRAEHYFFMNMGRTFDSDVNEEEHSDFYGPAVYCKEFHSQTLHATTADNRSLPPSKEYLEDWLVRTCELIDKYKPKILYFDWWIHNVAFKPYLKKLAAYYYNRAEEWSEEVTINYKHEAFPPTVATFDVERGALTGISPVPWQTDTAIGKRSWGYTKDNVFKEARQIICDLIDIVSKNGMLLLNIGPKPDGTITKEETKVLLDLGDWLHENGEGIYGTTFYKTYGEGEVNASGGYFTDGEEKPFTERDFRFTYKEGCVYAFWLRPKGTECVIKTFALKSAHDIEIEKVSLLGTGKEPYFKRTEEGLMIRLDKNPQNDLPVCFKIRLA